MVPPRKQMRLMDGWEGGAVYSILDRIYTILEGEGSLHDEEVRMRPVLDAAMPCIEADPPSAATFRIGTAVVDLRKHPENGLTFRITPPSDKYEMVYDACAQRYPTKRDDDSIVVDMVPRRTLNITEEDVLMARFARADVRSH